MLYHFSEESGLQTEACHHRSTAVSMNVDAAVNGQPADRVSPIRLGILSTAAVCRHLLALVNGTERRLAGLIEVVAVSSRSASKAESFAKQHNIRKVYTSTSALLADQDVEAVYIPLPNHEHTTAILAALHAGKHVLCEKPICLTSHDMKLIRAALETAEKQFQRPIVLMEAVMSLYTLQTAVVRNLLQSRVIGEVLYMRGVFQYHLQRQSHRQSPSSTGGGSLWDVGCYVVYLAQDLATSVDPESRAVNVQAVAAYQGACDVTFSGQFQYQTSTRLVPVQLVSSFAAPSECSSFEVVGTHGCIRLGNPFKPTAADVVEVELEQPKSSRSRHRLYPQSLSDSTLNALLPRGTFLAVDKAAAALEQRCGVYGAEWSAFHRCIRHGTRCQTGPDFSESCVTILESLHKSASAVIPSPKL